MQTWTVRGIPAWRSHAALQIFGALCLVLWLGGSYAAQASPSSKRGSCGVMVPKGSEDLGGGRYSSGGYEDIDGILKFYRKVYGSDGKNYKLRQLFVLRHVSAYHLRSLNSSSGWSGINVAFYRNRRNYRLQIYVICRS
ncbi:hypothetical protein L6R29_08840 [Myxococcota bacterium]|nr:hypothetical protein [Myxococcota bacterium]